MKAVFMTGYNQPLEVREAENYKELGPKDVLIKVEMTGVCFRDILTVQGYFPKAKPPLILGHEVTGEIVEVGSEVNGEFKEGTKVVSLPYIPCGECNSCKNGQENLCKRRLWLGEDVQGSYAEYVKAHENSLVSLPQGVSPEGAAIAACVTGMVIHAFKNVGGIRNGDTVLVTGAGGGVGIHAVQVAKAFGARVIGLTSSPNKMLVIKKFGADEVLLHDEKVLDKIKELTGGEGVDVVLEAVGEPTFQLSLRSVRWGGRIALVGNVTASTTNLPLGLMILRENAVMGTLSSTKQDVKEALEMTASGKVKPVGETLPLERAQEAHEAVRQRKVTGRVFLKP